MCHISEKLCTGCTDCYSLDMYVYISYYTSFYATQMTIA